MIDTLQILAIMLISIAMAPVLAHAFEYPGKMRLTREDYVTVQAIYYPGFTIAGASEPAGVVAVLLLLLVTPAGTPEFWLTLAALIGVLGMQAIYWAFIHPTNGSGCGARRRPSAVWAAASSEWSKKAGRPVLRAPGTWIGGRYVTGGNIRISPGLDWLS